MRYPVMLFALGDPREACAVAEDEEQAQALRAQGYKTLDESGMHPDQFREGAEVVTAVVYGDDAPQVVATPIKRGPGRPRKD